VYNVYTFAAYIVAFSISSAGNAMLHGLFMQGTVITQMTDGACGLCNTVLQI